MPRLKLVILIGQQRNTAQGLSFNLPSSPPLAFNFTFSIIRMWLPGLSGIGCWKSSPQDTRGLFQHASKNAMYPGLCDHKLLHQHCKGWGFRPETQGHVGMWSHSHTHAHTVQSHMASTAYTGDLLDDSKCASYLVAGTDELPKKTNTSQIFSQSERKSSLFIAKISAELMHTAVDMMLWNMLEDVLMAAHLIMQRHQEGKVSSLNSAKGRN